MKKLSQFIKELETLKEEKGDLPVVTSDPEYGECIDNDDSFAIFEPKHVFDSTEEEYKDCIVIY